MDEIFFENLREIVKRFKENVGGHELSHTERVYNLGSIFAKKEKADSDIVKAAAFLHDVARMKEEKGEIKCHAEEGAKMAREILEKTDFPKDKIAGVSECIRTHRYSKNLKAETKEAEIIQDADRLDALGAVCIARIFSHGGKNGRPIHNPDIKPREFYDGSAATSSINHFYEKILKIKPEMFNTESARKIAKHRYKFVENFIKEFLDEWEGKR